MSLYVTFWYYYSRLSLEYNFKKDDIKLWRNFPRASLQFRKCLPQMMRTNWLICMTWRMTKHEIETKNIWQIGLEKINTQRLRRSWHSNNFWHLIPVLYSLHIVNYEANIVMRCHLRRQGTTQVLYFTIVEVCGSTSGRDAVGRAIISDISSLSCKHSIL